MLHILIKKKVTNDEKHGMKVTYHILDLGKSSYNKLIYEIESTSAIFFLFPSIKYNTIWLASEKYNNTVHYGRK